MTEQNKLLDFITTFQYYLKLKQKYRSLEFKNLKLEDENSNLKRVIKEKLYENYIKTSDISNKYQKLKSEVQDLKIENEQLLEWKAKYQKAKLSKKKK